LTLHTLRGGQQEFVHVRLSGVIVTGVTPNGNAASMPPSLRRRRVFCNRHIDSPRSLAYRHASVI
jgi:hypothetical protein